MSAVQSAVAEPEFPPVTELSPIERRVLGVLVEKALTTPDQYPLTVKSLVAGCNQKSNRDPVTNYNEDAVLEALESLRKKGLATEVHTSSGRTARYRHFLRQRFSVSEPQVAILTELLLRGRQTLGELRARAARMVPIDSLDQLRDELRGLLEAGLVQANGPLDRRGVEVDHALYRPSEEKTLPATVFADDSAAPVSRPAADDGRVAELEQDLRALREECSALRAELGELRSEFQSFRESLGG